MARGWGVHLSVWIFAVASTGSAPALAQDYTTHHPRLAFTRAEIAPLRQKLSDGGPDDEAYAFVQHLVLDEYPTASLSQLMGVTFGMNFLLNLGLVAQLDTIDAEAARGLGLDFTLALADSFAADDNVFFSPVRLRALCFGYDMCMDDASETERAYVRAEIEAYVDSLMHAFNYERWLHPPYASNITAMIGASLGLAAVCLADEMDPARVDAALKRADTFVETWMRYHLDPDGACAEGVQYGTWAMRHLPWYFEARRRFDGKDYARIAAIRRIENWLAYEILPEPGGRVNNLNDTAYLNQPISRHNTFTDWALTRWSSGISAWTRERVLGSEDGYDWGANADKASTVLWYRDVPVVQPGDVLPPAFLWRQRGLYYYRTGWPRRGGSDDVVFTFYAGKFEGGHAQEDQNQFTLYAYGTRLAADNGFDRPNAESEAHNLVFVDGKGQHNAGGSTGTDGRIVTHVLSGYADYVFGDATAAYSTHSDYNNPGVPFPDDDWSAGYDGGNPVERAFREWIVVHKGQTSSYFIVLDDVKKDDALRTYDWRMHTEATHTIDTAQNPIRIEGARARLWIDVTYPRAAEFETAVTTYANPSADPDTRVLVVSQHAESGGFALVLRPESAGAGGPSSRTVSLDGGGVTVLAWPGGITDLVLANVSGAPVTSTEVVTVTTDARLAQLRVRDGVVRAYAMSHAASCTVGGVPYVRIRDGSASLVLDGPVLHLDRSADFTVFAPEVTSVRVEGRELSVVREGAYLTSAPSGGSAAVPRPLRLEVYPQPCAGAATIVLAAPAGRVTVQVFDVAGRLVRTLWEGPVAAGRTPLVWDGRDETFRALSSGVYFVRARSNSAAAAAKVVLVR